jgi:hypothetical protein
MKDKNMLFSRSKAWAPLLGVILLGSWGCDGGGTAPPVSSSRTEATVSGKVTIKGRPATKGQVIFDSANISRKDVAPVSAPIGSDGAYSAKTLVGENRVTVQSPELTTPELQYNESTFDVQSGDNKLDIALPRK